MKSMFSGLITSKTRIRILMRLFLNPNHDAYLRELATEFNISPSLIKEELHQLSDTGFLASRKNGRQIRYSANTRHPLFSELHSMVKKAMGMDRIIESIVERLGALEEAYLIDDYAEGKDTGLIDLVLIGNIDTDNLQDLTAKTERYIERKIRTLVLTAEEYRKHQPMLAKRSMLLLWKTPAANDGQANSET